MPSHPYTAFRSLATYTYTVRRADSEHPLATGLERKAALSMRDRLNDQARRATSIAPPNAR